MLWEEASRQCGARMGGDTQNLDIHIQRPPGWSQGWERAPHQPSHEAWKSSFPEKGPDRMASRQPSARLSERVSAPRQAYVLLPSPKTQWMQQFTLWIYYCSHSCPLPPGKSLQPGRNLLSPCGCQHHPLSPLSLLVPGSDHSGVWCQPRPT